MRHGGLLRRLTGERFADPSRPFHELFLSGRLREQGIPTPLVVGVRARQARPGWRLELLTVRVRNALPLDAFLERARRRELSARERAGIARSIGALVGRLHRSGIFHADLTPRNLLVEEASPAKAWVIDLDRSYEDRSGLSDAQRRLNLSRFLRSTLRIEAWREPFLTRTDRLRFLQAYLGELRPVEEGEADGRGWKGEWREIDALHREGILWHWLAGRLEEVFGGGPRSRDLRY